MPTSIRRLGNPVPSTTNPLRMMRSYSAMALLHAREGRFAVADDEELQSLRSGDKAVGLVGGDDGHVLGLHRLTVEHAAAFEHHEHLTVIVTVYRGIEVRRDSHDLGIEATVALSEELASRAL